MMKLYYSDILSSRRACSVAKYLGAPVEYVYLDLTKGDQKKPDYLAVNPNGKVPTLVNGNRITWEADAVMCQLSEDMRADLWPRDLASQIETVRWFSWNHQHLTRAGGGLYFEYIVKQRFGIGEPDSDLVSEQQAEFRRCAGILNNHLQGRRWLLGDNLTVADFSVAMTLPFAEQAHLPVNEFPQVCRWYDRLNDIEAWREPYPTRFATPHAA
jgi:glutathione S-transferase